MRGKKMSDNRFHIAPARLIVAVAAAALIAVCAWCAGIYAAGGDPLAFLSSELFNTVADDQGSAYDADSARESWEPSVEDVEAELRNLEFDGGDVSVDDDEEPAVVVSGDGVWVETRLSVDLSEAAEISACRTAALAGWLADRGAEEYRVTWIAEDSTGSVLAAMCLDASAAPIDGGLPELLAACSSYRLSDACYEAVSGLGVDQSSGEAPMLPDGSEIPFKEADDSSTSSVLIEQGSDAGQDASDGLITVSVTVDGSSVGAGSSSASVSLAAGATVYDALLETGVNVNAQSTAYGIYVSAIAGLAEKEHGDMSGWVFTVNGSTINTSASDYSLSDGDQVRWSYVVS